MPQRIVCDQCNCVLYEGDDLKPPDEVINQYEGKCPGCGKKLSLVPINFEVHPA